VGRFSRHTAGIILRANGSSFRARQEYHGRREHPVFYWVMTQIWMCVAFLLILALYDFYRRWVESVRRREDSMGRRTTSSESRCRSFIFSFWFTERTSCQREYFFATARASYTVLNVCCCPNSIRHLSRASACHPIKPLQKNDGDHHDCYYPENH